MSKVYNKRTRNHQNKYAILQMSKLFNRETIKTNVVYRKL